MGNIIGTFGSSAAAASSARIAADSVPTGTRQHLSAEQLSLARDFLEQRGMPADHLENVVFVKGMTGHGWIVDRARENGNPAIIRGNVVYVRDDFWATATNPARETFWSEIYHTSQYQQGSFESRYLSGMIGSVLTGGDGHANNIMEEVAHARGREMAQLWSRARRQFWLCSFFHDARENSALCLSGVLDQLWRCPVGKARIAESPTT